MDYEKALKKLGYYCAYQERCLLEVRRKLSGFELTDIDRQKIIQKLEEEDFLNEERFAESYARGKFSNNRWGRAKIRGALYYKNINDRLIERGISLLDPKEYKKTIKRLIEVKLKIDRKITKDKMVKYLQQKGYTFDEVKPYLGKLK